MEVNEATELRKLPALHHAELGRILDDMDNWKNLMSKIPKKLEKENFKCDVTPENLPKYISEHFRLIEQASKKSNRSCSEILFEEWGCSGRVRPSVGHLFHLLQKAELYRAADYVAKNILHRDAPPRPNSGPLAQVKFNTIERQKLEDSTLQDIEQILDAIDYPSSAIEQIRNSINLPSNDDNAAARVVPKIVVSEMPSYDSRQNPFNYAIPVAAHENTSSRKDDATTNSDMMKFSASNVESSRPPISMLLNESNKSLQSNDLPNLTELNIAEGAENPPADAQSNDMPNLSALMRTNSEHSVTATSKDASGQINLSDLMRTNSEPSVSGQALEQVSSAGAFLPATLLSSSANIIRSASEDKMHGLKTSAANSKHCTSPLPSLSLNTHLPHFSYAELEAATNNFDETPYADGGRFLGCGGFSSVYLAVGILNKRAIAVKRINLKDLNIVRADDFVTKQFKNEVEVLCKYKHDNLLSLLGYSCDGLTYCLLYEYMPGGNLEDRLERAKGELIWTQRLHIAMGTARGINYLHTAYSSPLIHRDVKSANILLDSTNKPKLSDFGIMRISSSNTTETSRIFGTAAYMAPESLRGDVSVKMDTYSFGVVLLELITGLPSRGCNRAGIDLITHVQDSLNDEEDISPLLDTGAGSWISKNVNFANELYKIASKCLQYKKNMRPTMTDVTKMLSQVLQQS